MLTARTPQRILLPALGLALTGLMAVCPARCRATEPVAHIAVAGTSPARSTPLLAKRHLAYAAIGGTASWLAFRHENATTAANAIDDSPLDLGGDLGNQYGRLTVAPILNSRFGWKVGVPAHALAIATGLGRVEDHWHFPSDVIAGATLGLIVGESVARRSSSMPHLPENLYVGKKGLGLQFGF